MHSLQLFPSNAPWAKSEESEARGAIADFPLLTICLLRDMQSPKSSNEAASLSCSSERGG